MSESVALMIFLGLAGKSGDHVRANGRVGKPFAHKFRAARIVLGAIPAVHRRQDAVRAGLQRHVEVPRHPLARRENRDQIFRDVHRFDGTDAQPLDGRFVQDAAQHFSETVRAV